jgi:hypothetical protein
LTAGAFVAQYPAKVETTIQENAPFMADGSLCLADVRQRLYFLIYNF